MKNYLIGFVPAALLAIAVITYVNNSSVNSNYNNNQAKPGITVNIVESKPDECCKIQESAGVHSENSIYQLSSTWKDQNGNSIQLKKFQGKKVVLAMIYSSCPTACPVIVNNMQKLEASIPKKDLAYYHFILVSIDPDRDTPQRLMQFASGKSLNMTTWTLLTGSKDDVAELAELIGFKYKKNSQGNFIHSNLITFLDKYGVIMDQSEGLEQSNQELLTMLNK